MVSLTLWRSAAGVAAARAPQRRAPEERDEKPSTPRNPAPRQHTERDDSGRVHDLQDVLSDPLAKEHHDEKDLDHQED